MNEIIKNKKGIYLNSIDQTIWREFKNMTKLKHGKIHGALGQEVEKALLFYMKSGAHTEKIPTKKYPKIRNKEQNFVKIAKELFSFNKIHYKNLVDLILNTGISDYRAIESYIKSFSAMHWISETPEMPSYLGKLYEVDHDMINLTLARYEDKYNISFDF